MNLKEAALKHARNARKQCEPAGLALADQLHAELKQSMERDGIVLDGNTVIAMLGLLNQIEILNDDLQDWPFTLKVWQLGLFTALIAEDEK